MTDNQLYYATHVPGKLIDQEDLCTLLRQNWPDYSIETEQTTGTHANPMTIRLLQAQDALKKIRAWADQYARESSGGIRPQHASGYRPGYSSGYESVIVGSQFSSTLHWFHLGTYVQTFYSSAGTALDRIGLEINLLFDLGLSKPDFGQLFDNKGFKFATKTALGSVMSRSYVGDCIRFSRYRNRELHDAIIPITQNGLTGLFLPTYVDNRGKTTGSRSELLKTISTQFVAIETLIGEVYSIVLAELRKGKSLPL